MIADTMSAALHVIANEMPAGVLDVTLGLYRAFRRAISEGQLDDAEFFRRLLSATADHYSINHYAFLQAIGMHADGLVSEGPERKEGCL